MIIDFDSTGVALLIPGAVNLPEDMEVPPQLTDLFQRLEIDEDPKTIRWIAVYLDDLLKLRTENKPIKRYNYYRA